MTKTDLLMILAILIGPVLAVQVQKFLEIWKEKRNNKLEIFKTLMATRGSTLSAEHVQALNRIDLEFDGKTPKKQAVVETWKQYLDHLGDGPKDFESGTFQMRLETWSLKNAELLTELLYAMAICLGYHFDKVHLQKGVYAPQGHVDLEVEHSLVRRGTIEVLSGRRSIPIVVSQEPAK